MTRRIPLFSKLIFLLFLLPVSALCADPSPGYAALQHGRVDEAERALRGTLAANPHDAYAHQLLCRVFYAQDFGERAVAECEAAVADSGNDSVNLDWLGKAYGLKASHVNPISAFSLAKRVRATFERAVQADPANVQALSDLGEFCVAAPSIAGGDTAKARQIAAGLMAASPEAAHRLLGLIAQGDHDNTTAEAEFKKAVAVKRSPGAYTDLALFYQTHKQMDEALAACREAIRADRAHGPALVDAASILMDARQAPELAEQALRDYLDSPAQTDEAPVFKAEMKLGKLLAARGDTAGAQRAYSAAHALANNFAAARDAVKGA